MKEVMGFMPPFFSGSSAVPECVVSSNSFVYSEPALGSHLVTERVRVLKAHQGTECLLLDVHQKVKPRPVLL